MGTKEILGEIKKLPYTERLIIVEETLKIIKEEPGKSIENGVREMESEYKTNKDLTAFSSIDTDDFYEAK
jgi:hypothetical protein